MPNEDLGSYLKEMSRRADAMKPKLVSNSSNYRNRQIASEVLPEGSTVSPLIRKRADMANWGGQSTSFGGTGGGNSVMHTMRPYMPEFDSPDRQWYPDNRLEANHYWRLFYKYDPFFGTAVDMYAGMMTSDFDIVLADDTDKSIQNQLNYMCEKTRFLDKFQQMVKEFLVLGEAFPHNFFDKEQGIWSYIAFHNPDYVEVQDSPIIDMDPILNFIPDESLRDFLTSNTPESIEIRNRLPSEFVSKVLARQKIRLSPLNCSFVPRLLHPYDERGVSLASRLWRIWMVEDAVYSSTIATFRRSACFVAGTRILTSKGIKPIEEIQVGDTVVSGEGLLKKVEAAWEDHTNDLVEIKINGSETLRCTPNHRFKLWVSPRLCSCGCGQELGNISGGTPRTYITNHCETKRDSSTGRLIKSAQTWKQLSVDPNVRVLEGYEPIQTLNAEDIRRSDYLLIPRKFEQLPMEVTSKDLSMARLLGYYVAEGSFSLSEFETWAKDIEEIGKDLGVHVRVHQYSVNDGIREGGTSVCIDHVSDLWLASWCFEHGGLYSGSKVFSETVMSWPLEMKKQLIIGLFRGDGHSRKDEEAVHYATTSPSLAYQVRLILAQMGVLGSVSVNCKKQEKWNDIYNVISCGNGGRYLSKLVWDKDLVYKGSRVTHAWHWMDEDYIYVKVLKVTKVKEDCSVYNMTVEGDHSYIANGIATRNSPLKVIKQGDANTGWIPDPSTEQDLLRMLAAAELDPQAYLVTHYGVNFEQWGGGERAITLSRENETIEKVKLMALGLSKSFMSGEVSFSCQFENAKILKSDFSYEDIENIEVGDTVLDIYGDSKAVTHTMNYPSPDTMVEVNLYGGKQLCFTGNHRLPVFARPRKCLCGCGEDLKDRKSRSHGFMYWSAFLVDHHQRCNKAGRERVWVDYMNEGRGALRYPQEFNPHCELEAKDLVYGDYLKISRKFEESDIPATAENLAKARLLGYYVAEGSNWVTTASKGTSVTRFSFGNSEKELQYANDAVAICELLGYKAKVYYESDSCYTVILPTGSSKLSDWLIEHGAKLSSTKRLSGEVLHWNLKLKRELLKGLYRGDGYLRKSGNLLVVNLVTTSKVLASQVELILAQLGYFSHTTTVKPFIDSRGYDHKSSYRVNTSSKLCYPLAESIWGDVPYVWSKLDFTEFFRKDRQGENTTAIKDDNYIYVPIKSVNIVVVDKEVHPCVYSLTVDGSHSYTTENICSFNSAKSGLQVFLRRLLSMRQFFEQSWILPKFFAPIVEINDWVKSTPAEVNNRIKVKRTAQEAAERGLLITPKIKWRNKLDPTVDAEVIQAYASLKTFGFDVSMSSVGSAVSLNWEDELRKKALEFKTRESILSETLGETLKQKFEQQAQQGAKPPGGAGSGAMPPGAPSGAPSAPGGAKPKQEPGGKPVSNPPGSAEGVGTSTEGIEGPGTTGIG